MEELHDAYVGVVEVLSRYLNSADPKTNDQATRVSLLSQMVAAQMGLPDKAADNIRVAALLRDIKHIKVTAKVIRKAVVDLEHSNRPTIAEHTFNGSDLVYSLGTVLTGAWPLLLDHSDCLDQAESGEEAPVPTEATVGTSIIRTVKSYLMLLGREPRFTNPRDAINTLRKDIEGDHNPAVLRVLERVVFHSIEAASEHAELEPIMAHAE